MAIGQQAGEGQIDHVGLADHDIVDLSDGGGEGRLQAGHIGPGLGR